MHWLFFALLSPLIFTGVNFVDKYIIEKEIREPRSMVLFAAVMSGITGAVLWVVTGFPTLAGRDLVLALLSGACNIWAAAFYFEAMLSEETSRIIVLMQMVPVFVLALAALFLHERIQPVQLVGFGLILSASIASSLDRSLGQFRLSKAFFLILITNTLVAASLILFKLAVNDRSFVPFLSYESWGLTLGGALVYLLAPSLRRSFHISLKSLRPRGLAFIGINETLYVTAKLIGFVAITLGPVALVSVIGSTQVFFGIFYGWMLTTLLPGIFREDISRANLIRKGALALVLFGGIVLVG